MGKTLEAVEVQREFSGLSLGDRRIEARARGIVTRLCEGPSDSFPEQMGSDAELEGLYRFFANPKVTMASLLAGHVRATHERMHGRPLVRIIHDTTPFRFEGDRHGLGIIRGNVKGFFGHLSLAVSADDAREPLGVVALQPFIHSEALAHRGMTASQRVAAGRKKPRAERESSRWETQAIAVANQLPAGTRAIHLMDQEGDDFYVLATLQAKNIGYVIRADPGRMTRQHEEARAVLARRPAKLLRTVHLTQRAHYKNRRKGHPVRSEREAKLELRWAIITLPRGAYVDMDVDALSVTAVHVFERNPPAGEEAIEWMLLTSEKVASVDDATEIVDHYRARWIVEEYFKALKTGCAIEKRQLTSFDGLTSALALFVPIAWRLLALRHLGRAEPSRAARCLFDSEQLLLLSVLLAKRNYVLPAAPSLRDVTLGIARLGGHIRNNGDPGWLVLGRGHVRFAEAESVWRLARRSDQS
jgi:hypothetical protein